MAFCFQAKAVDQANAGVNDKNGLQEEIRKVEVRASANMNDRKTANAAKVIINHADIERFGDTNVADVLRRVPGITVSGSGAQAQEISMRGLGGGYTQILVNGEPMPAGFSLATLSPEVIDRIEVIRSATADMSTQSIAGTINVILKRPISTNEQIVKMNASTYGRLWSGGIADQWSRGSGNTTYSVNGSVNYDHNLWPSSITQHAESAGGSGFSRLTNVAEEITQLKLDLLPRFSWKPSSAQQLNIDGLLGIQKFEYLGDEKRHIISGTPPTFPSNILDLVNHVKQVRASVQWKSPIGEAGKFEAKITLSGYRRVSDGLLKGFDETRNLILTRTIDSLLQDSNLISTGKYSVDLTHGHALGVGWAGEYGRRNEDRIQREVSTTGFPTQDMDEDYNATVSKLALYAQDEWELSPGLSAYLGVRWEGLKTRTLGNNLSRVSNWVDVVSPTFQLLWKLPSTKGDQLRIALGRTYKPPTARDLIPRRWIVNDNTATSPNFQGNPNLRPELAWGLDAGYEHYMDAGFTGANVYMRRIDNVIQQEVYNEDGTWISTPFNAGGARVFGIELEAKVKLSKVVASAPDIDFRMSATRNWSVLDKVPAPGNHLGQQPPLTYGLGADYSCKAIPLTVGANFKLDKGVFVRSSIVQSTEISEKRVLDMYGRWQIDKATQLRLTLANFLKLDDITKSRYNDGVLLQDQVLTASSHRTIRLQLEMRL
jgi:outer membrane receptor for ferrienterochelin and colicin